MLKEKTTNLELCMQQLSFKHEGKIKSWYQTKTEVIHHQQISPRRNVKRSFMEKEYDRSETHVYIRKE